MYNLGILLAAFWEPPDLPAARDWYTKAAAAGHTKAMSDLGRTSFDEGDLPAARDWFTKAAAAGDTTAMTNLQVLDRNMGRHWPRLRRRRDRSR
jgi:TPR repeat protein